MFLLFELNGNLLEQLSRSLVGLRGTQREPAELWYTLGVALRNVGLYQEAAAALEHCLEEGGESPVAFRAALFLARIATLQGNWERARQFLEWAKKRARDERDELNLVNVGAGLLLHQSRVKESVETLEAAIQHLVEKKDSELLQKHRESWAYALVSYAGGLILLDRTEEAIRLLQDALEGFARVPAERDRHRGMVLAYINLGEAYRLEQRHEEARKALETAADLAQKHTLQDFQFAVYLNLAHVLADAGTDLDRAAELLEQAEAYYQAQHEKGDTSPANLVEVQFIRAKILWHRGEKDQAIALARKALEGAAEYTFRDKEAQIAETLYRWTRKSEYRKRALRAYEIIGNTRRSEALQKGNA